MRKNALLNCHSIIFTWALSYLSVLLVPIIISGVVYVESKTVIEKEINRANESLLYQVQQVIDGRMSDIERLCLEVAWNPRVQSLLYAKNQMDGMYQLNVVKVIQDLKTYHISNNYISEMYIYYKNGNIALTTDTKYDGNSLSDYINVRYETTYEEWLMMVNEKHIRDVIPIKRRKTNGEVTRTLAYVRSIPVDNPDDSAATMVIMIDEDKLMETVEGVKAVDDNRTLFIIDKKNSILATSSSIQLPLLLKYDNFLKESGLIYGQLDNEKAAFSYIQSGIFEWKYITAVPTRIFWVKSEYLRLLMYISIIISVLLGGLVSFLFLKKNYVPISELVKSIANKAGGTHANELNEYHYLKKAISEILNESDRINNWLKQQNSVLKSSFLIRLFKGNLESKVPIHESLSNYDIHFESDSFAIMLFYIEDYSRLFTDNKDYDPKDRFKLVQFIITNIVEEITGRNNLGYMTEVDGLLVCLINFREKETAAGKQEMYKTACESQKFIKEKFQIDFTVAISDIHQSIGGISQAYSEALNAMEYKLVMGSGEIICYDNIKCNDSDSSQSYYYYPMNVEQQLINYIKYGDIENVKVILEEVFQKSFSINPVSLQMAKCLMFDLINTIIKTMVEVSNVCERAYIEELKPVDKLLGCNSIQDMKIQMISILENVCEYIETKKKSVNTYKVRDDVVKFVNNHYNDINLNISMIAEDTGITAPYLSKLFKEQTGEALLDFINKVRLERAKKFLKDEGYSIYDTAIKVGYNDCNTFIRIFKKYEGITPGKFKVVG